MSTATIHSQTIPNPGRLPVAEGLRRLFFVCVVVGVAAFAQGRFKDAISIFKTMSTSKNFEAFLTLPAYKKII